MRLFQTSAFGEDDANYQPSLWAPTERDSFRQLLVMIRAREQWELEVSVMPTTETLCILQLDADTSGFIHMRIQLKHIKESYHE